MARFNLDDYETVEERIKRFYKAHPDGRIGTYCELAGADGKWLFKAIIYLNAQEQEKGTAKATGYASETEGGPQSEWKAELGETSAIGRALANAGFSGNKRASREEMKKVAKAEEPKDWSAMAAKLEDVEALRQLWAEAKAAGAHASVLAKIKSRAEGLQNNAS
jgi:hypothetical protein